MLGSNDLVFVSCVFVLPWFSPSLSLRESLLHLFISFPLLRFFKMEVMAHLPMTVKDRPLQEDVVEVTIEGSREDQSRTVSPSASSKNSCSFETWHNLD